MNPSRARYVKMIGAIRDLPRDVGVLAGRPTGSGAASLAAWSVAWQDWWYREKEGLKWIETAGTWVRATGGVATKRAWPPIPESERMPSELLPAPLIDALEKLGEDTFGPAFRAWIDSGAIRDREILQAWRLLPDPSLSALMHGSL